MGGPKLQPSGVVTASAPTPPPVARLGMDQSAYPDLHKITSIASMWSTASCTSTSVSHSLLDGLRHTTHKGELVISSSLCF